MRNALKTDIVRINEDVQQGAAWLVLGRRCWWVRVQCFNRALSPAKIHDDLTPRERSITNDVVVQKIIHDKLQKALKRQFEDKFRFECWIFVTYSWCIRVPSHSSCCYITWPRENGMTKGWVTTPLSNERNTAMKFTQGHVTSWHIAQHCRRRTSQIAPSSGSSTNSDSWQSEVLNGAQGTCESPSSLICLRNSKHESHESSKIYTLTLKPYCSATRFTDNMESLLCLGRVLAQTIRLGTSPNSISQKRLASALPKIRAVRAGPTWTKLKTKQNFQLVSEITLLYLLWSVEASQHLVDFWPKEWKVFYRHWTVHINGRNEVDKTIFAKAMKG